MIINLVNLAENTFLNNSAFQIIEIDKIAVKGKTAAETIFTCFESNAKITDDCLTKHMNFLKPWELQELDIKQIICRVFGIQKLLI